MKAYVIMGSDEHARAVQAYLAAKGFYPRLFDTQWDWSIVGDNQELTLVFPDSAARVANSEVLGFYWRWYGGVHAPTETERTSRESLLKSWLKMVDPMAACNHYDAWQLHATKPYQNHILDRCLSDHNISVADSSYRMLDKPQWGTVCKPAQGGSHAFEVNSINGGLVNKHCNIQERYHGQTMRVYAFRKTIKCLAYRMSWDEVHYVDYRQDANCKSQRWPHAEDLANGMHYLLTAMRWNWCGADLVYDAGTGRYTLLDFNPSPMFLGFQEECEVLEALCNEVTCNG